ncbi:MAG: dTDP-glucose 4,6-dehydratase [Gemmatimonadaceae bacterium]|nr:dTDP-glucose 4,6-dehydratase [Gemmatimonadaceae bacterium]
MTAPVTFTPSTVLVTGGAGFIGSNLVRWLLRNEPALTVINLDLLTYAGNVESLADVEAQHGPKGDGRYRFVQGDIRDAELVATVLGGAREGQGMRGAGTLAAAVPAPVIPHPSLPSVNCVLHLAAESHVDRSISGPAEFVSTNVQGTLNLLACTRAELEANPREFRFVNVSTDEVYGSLGPGDPGFTERHPLAPNSPYSASKAGADMLVRAYRETFGLPCLTTRCSNNYGPYQFPEKLIPLMITRALGDQPLPVYGDGMNIRDWLHVDDHAAAIWAVATRGRLEDEVYNIGGESEVPNIEVIQRLLAALGKPESLIAYVKDRPGHDRRYAMDITRIRETLGWHPTYTFERGLEETVAWYVANREWWQRVQSEAYRSANAMYLAGDEA